MKLTNQDIRDIAFRNGIEYASLKAFIEVESSGYGFGSDGKLIIQFEPHIFSRKLKEIGISHTLTKVGNKYYFQAQVAGPLIMEGHHPGVDIVNYKIVNGVEGQKKEWEAFNIAFKIDADSAMLSTSIGLPQIMGFHYSRLGFSTVGEMWDYFKRGEKEQVEMLVKFIKTDSRLSKAIKEKNWHLVATYYNGSGYKAMAKQLGVTPYDIRLANAYKKYSV